MHRYKLIIEYHGAPFVGWQRQLSGISVQSALEDAISILCKHDVSLVAAGRTDAGVHALGQVVHFDSINEIDASKFIRSLNYFLRPHPIVILSCEEVEKDFHARFSAKSRSYIYKILNRPSPSTIHNGLTWHVIKKLDHIKMHEAAQVLVGKHDFSSFRATHCQSASPIKSINSISVTKDNDIVQISINAPSFLHNQVRIITGSLKMVGEGKWDIKKIEYLLSVKDRTKAGQTAPSDGLFFYNVEY